MEVMKDLYPRDASSAYTKGTVVAGTLKGDVHDLGKNILRRQNANVTILAAFFYKFHKVRHCKKSSICLWG